MKPVGEKDSTTGLMVWPDVQPEEKPDRVLSPKPCDEPGAMSEVGVEVLDDAKGPVTELVVLYPAPAKPGTSTPPVSPSTMAEKCQEHEGESTLSHLSLQENADWIQIEPKNLDGEGEGSRPLDLDEIMAAKSESTNFGGSQSQKTPDKGSNTLLTEEQEQSEEISEVQDTIEDVKTRNKMSIEEEMPTAEKQEEISGKDETIDELNVQTEETPEAEVESKDNMLLENATSDEAAYSDKNETQQYDSSEEKKSLESSGSDIAMKGSITKTTDRLMDFIKTREVGYSVVEIRGGRYGEKSFDRLESGDGPMMTETEHHLSVDSSESDIQIAKPDVPYWVHVPGIGPMISESQILAVVEYMQHCASKQQGMVGPRNINHLLCPPLDIPPLSEDEDTKSIY